MPAISAHQQAPFVVRFEWGLTGGLEVAAGARYVVVVDVLSFTTSVSIAVDGGAIVYPFGWAHEGAVEFAAEHDAVLALGRTAARRTGGLSLSPASILAARHLQRLVLPSPNGSAVSVALSDSGHRVIAASLRNAETVAEWLAGQLTSGESLAVVAAGERWPGGSLRPAVEDLWGAGAVVAALAAAGLSDVSPEAQAAADAFRCVRSSIANALKASASGRELVDRGFADDVRVAADLSAGDVVPVLIDGAFQAPPVPPSTIDGVSLMV